MNIDENTLFKRLLVRLRQATPAATGTVSSTWASITGKPNFSPVATSGAYSDLSGRPSLFSGAYVDLTGLPSLFDGKWSSLTGKPAVFDGTWDSLTNKPASFASTWAQVSGKPTLFSGAYADLTGKPSLTQAAYAQTDSTGLLTWTFSQPFATGVLPVIGALIQDATAGTIFGVRVVSRTNLSVTIQVSKSAAVTVAGISVLGAAVGVQTYLHLTATAPI